MSELRWFGLISGCIIAAYVVWQFWRHHLRKGDLLLGLLIASVLIGIGLDPLLVNGLQRLLQTQTRPMALAIASIIALFGLFLYMLKELSSVRRSVGDLVRAS